MKHGDFTGLAANYSLARPDYSKSVLEALIALVGKPRHEIDAVDVGAGTGIWTRMLADSGLKSVVAVEPNADMREQGIADSAGTGISWHDGSGEDTKCGDNSCDFLSMASSFHWVDFDRGTREFHRVLRPGGRFVALWNPRYIAANPLLVEVEEHLQALKPDMKRVSSGRSGVTETLTERLNALSYFDDVIYIEGRHIINMTPEQYINAWRSVNDIQVQLGAEKFADFIEWLEGRFKDIEVIEATYLTRAWSARARS